MFDWVIYSLLKILKVFKVKVRWSKSLRLLKRVAFLVQFVISHIRVYYSDLQIIGCKFYCSVQIRQNKVLIVIVLLSNDEVTIGKKTI